MDDVVLQLLPPEILAYAKSLNDLFSGLHLHACEKQYQIELCSNLAGKDITSETTSCSPCPGGAALASDSEAGV